MESQPLISVVIPTRERCETLAYAIESALDQKSNDYEVIVSDNASEDRTGEVIRSFSDPRLRGIRTDRRLSMADHWEFALGHVRGRYVMFIGDDDGVMPGGVDKLSSLIRSDPFPIYRWLTHNYYWPIDQRSGRLDYLSRRCKPRIVDIRKLARQSVSWGGWRWSLLPNPYHGLVRTDLLDQIRSTAGRVYVSTQPDVFLCFALPAVTPTFMDPGEAFTVNGWSAKANGGSVVSRQGAEVISQFLREYQDYQLKISLYPGIPVAWRYVVEAILIAMEMFPDLYRGVSFNYSAMLAVLLRTQPFDSLSGIIRKRADIRRYQSFSVPEFIWWGLAQKAFAFRKQAMAKILSLRAGRQAHPQSMRDCLRTVQRLMSA